MDKKFKIGDRVVFNASMRYRSTKQSFDIEMGDIGTVSDTQYPPEWFITVTLEKQPERPVTVPSDIVDLYERHCDECECDCAEKLTVVPEGFILLHDDATGEAVMYRSSVIGAFGDGYIVLKDGSEFDCEEGIEDIACQISKLTREGFIF